MLGLTRSATLYKKAGQSGGKPAWAETGEAFSCRIQPDFSRAASGKSVEADADVRVFARNIGAETGDKIVLDDGTRLLIAQVQRMDAPPGAHHLEILAKEGG